MPDRIIANLPLIRSRYAPERKRIDGTQARADVQVLLDRIGELEESLLAVGQLMWDDEDFGPRPPSSGREYKDYLSENVHGTAAEVRDAWKARGWRRG